LTLNESGKVPSVSQVLRPVPHPEKVRGLRRDLEQEALIGLHDAALTYRPERGAFSTWAAYYVGTRLDQFVNELDSYHPRRREEREAMRERPWARTYPQEDMDRLRPDGIEPSAEYEALQEHNWGQPVHILPWRGAGQALSTDRHTRASERSLSGDASLRDRLVRKVQDADGDPALVYRTPMLTPIVNTRGKRTLHVRRRSDGLISHIVEL
jgi:hypothetical protein